MMSHRVVCTVRHWLGLHNWAVLRPPHLTLDGTVIPALSWCTWCGRYR